MSILDFVRLGLVFLPHYHRLFAQHLRESDRALLFRQGELLVDRSVVKIPVLESIVDRGAVKYSFDIRPVAGCHAHWAGFCGGVQGATRELEALKRYTGEADRFHLRVPRWIVTSNDPVHTFGNNLAVFDKNGAKNAAGAVFQRRSL